MLPTNTPSDSNSRAFVVHVSFLSVHGFLLHELVYSALESMRTLSSHHILWHKEHAGEPTSFCSSEPASARFLCDLSFLHRKGGFPRDTNGFVAQAAMENFLRSLLRSSTAFLLLTADMQWEGPWWSHRCWHLWVLFEMAGSKLPSDTLECFACFLSSSELDIEGLWAWFPSPGYD